MRVLVTGSSGFIGSRVCMALLSRGHSVRGFDQQPGSVGQMESLLGDVRDEEAVRDAAAGRDAVIHLAAVVSVTASEREPELARQVNSDGAVAVGRGALDVPRLVFVSSAAIYGPRSGAIDEGSPCAPTSVYGRSKLEAENRLTALAADRADWLTVVRPFNVYGYGQEYRGADTPLIAAITHALQTGDAVRIRGDGSQRRDYVHVDDVANAIAAMAVRSDPVRGPVNLGTGTGRSILDVVDLAEEIAGTPIARRHARRSSTDVQESFADISLLKADDPSYDPKPLETGLRRTLERISRPPASA